MSDSEKPVSQITNQRYGTTIILSAFGIVGAITAAAIVFPENAAKVGAIIAATTSSLIAFIAGRATKT